MASRVGVLDVNQAESALPYSYVKRSVADLLVRRLFARRVHKSLIQLLAVKACMDLIRAESVIVKVVIPQLLPPRPPEGLLLSYPIKDQRTLPYASL